MTKRSYEQLCPVALSLDLIGERWTLLVIRNLLPGPQRYTDLLEGLPGIGAEMLASRLKTLEKEGIIQRRKLPAPAGSVVYELTEVGRGLEEPLIGIARWGLLNRFPKERGSLNFKPIWGILAFKAYFYPEAARGMSDIYECRIDDDVFQIRVEDGKLDLRLGPAEKPAVVMTTDLETYAVLGMRTLSFAEAIGQGKLRIEGDPEAMARFARIFRPPRPSTAQPTAPTD